jgi:anti-sigma regulatory factor (Ser/Thr protein kinase)
MTIPKIVLELSEDPSSAPLARLIGRNLLEHHAATQQDIDDVEILVDELCSNVTRHAQSEEGYFRITLEHHGDRITLTVEDHGPGLDPQRLLPVGSLRTDENEGERYGGFGIPIIRKLADEIRFEPRTPRGTRAYVQKRLHREKTV